MTLSRAQISEMRELARLEEQLDALEQDIRQARSTARRAARGRLDLRRHDEPEPAPSQAGEHIRLRDGAEIVVRPVETDDAEQLRRGFQHLGALSRYRAFLEPVDRLTEERVRQLTHVDHRAREELIAEDAASGECVALAGYAEDPEAPTEATLTVVVADAWQRRGVGTALIERVAACAHSAGVERLRVRTIVGDADVRRLLAHAGETLTESCEDGIARLTIALRPEG